MRTIRLLTAAALAAAGSVPATALLTASAAHAASAPPRTVPALKSWTAASGSFTWGPTSRVVVDPAFAGQLAGDANTFAADLSALENRTVTVTTGTAGPGDVLLTLGGSQPAEGYSLTVGASVTVQGSTTTGEFWGTRSVLQLLHQGPSIPAGTAADAPLKPERGMWIDAAPKFVPVDWIENEIRDMSYLKLNSLFIGFGTRLVSSTHPEIKPTVFGPGQYSRQDIADIIAVANAYHVAVVPEIDMPAHMDDILAAELAAGHDYRLKDGSGNPSGGGNIDVTQPAARQLVGDLLSEYLPWFTSSPYWHLGGDEIGDYSSTTPYTQLLTYARANGGTTAKDAFYIFVNSVDSLVKAGGKTARMWNDRIGSGDGTVAVNPDVGVEYWVASGQTPQQLAAAGHVVANENQAVTYYTYGNHKPDTAALYAWNPDTFDGGATITDAGGNPGSRINVWLDDPSAETFDQTAGGLKYPLRTLAQVTWSGPAPQGSTYASFFPVMDLIGRNPRWPAMTIPGDLAQGRPTTASSVQGTDLAAANATGPYGSGRWSSQFSDPQWIQVDLGSVQTVTRVVLAWEAAYGKQYTIDMSNDGVTWTTVSSQANGAGGTETLTGFVGTGRYIRMNGVTRGTQYGYSLYEFEVFNDHSLADNHPTTASSVQPNTGYAPNLATDGSSSTRWSSDFSDPQWIQIDLGSVQAVNRVVLGWEAAYGKRYTIDMSNDGVAWTTVYTQDDGGGGTESLTGFVGTGRYIRMNGIARGTQYGYSLYEFEVFDDDNLAYSRPTTASSVQPSTSDTASLATDGSASTRWSSDFSDPQWIQADLGSVQSVGRVVLAWEAAYGKAYQLQMSNDGTTWATVYVQSDGAGGTETVTGPIGTGRYIRMLGTARGTPWGYSLWSFQVYQS
ncbi:discoidin domain-containing protein [Catenulispora subtropica]|uniref:F5/8 type C domain-containing protein n=1 Tax=Catenulispora subtropica TaxID=450798 RepID=A0ABN2RC20_9ACTN